MGKETKNTIQGTDGEESTNVIISHIQQLFEGVTVVILPLIGMSNRNTAREAAERYSMAKRPTAKKWTDAEYQSLTEAEAQSWTAESGWLGLRIPAGYQLVDVDNVAEGELLYKALKAEGAKFHAMRTKNGYQFIFRDNPKNTTNSAKRFTACGLQVDYRLANKGQTVLPTANTPGREWLRTEDTDLDVVPVYLEVATAKEREFSVPIQEGSRNDQVFKWLSKLRELNQWDDTQLRQIAGFMNSYILAKPLPEYEVEALISQVMLYEPSGREYSANRSSIALTYDLSQIPGYTGPEGARMPQALGWGLQADTLALYQTRNGQTSLVSHQPIVITGRYANVTEGSVGLIVTWRDGFRWHKVTRGRDAFAIQNKLVELSSVGFPVSSVNARKLVEYLNDFEAINRHMLPEYRAAEQMGWVDGGFLLGASFMDSQGKQREAGDPQSVSFIGADTGDEQYIKGFHPSGSLDAWLSMVGQVKAYPRVISGIYASFASVLIELLGANLFIFEWAGETSKGKTIALRLAASVWGRPEERGNGIIRKWNASVVSLERIAGLSNHIPVFLDDTKEGDPKVMPRTVYQMTSGQGKGRGSIKGAQQTKYWRNVIFSTGEQKITSFSNDGGAVGRTISIAGLPFQEATHDTFKLVRELEALSKSNYGHAGQAFVTWVLQNKGDLEAWRSRWLQLQSEFVLTVQNVNSVAGRLTEYFALLQLTSELLDKVFGRKWGAKPIRKVWDELLADGEEMDRPREAVRYLYSVVRSYVNNFEQIGEWENSGGQWTNVKFYPHVVKEFFDKAGYEMTSTLKSWHERGWLDTTKGRGHKKQMKRNGGLVDFIVVKRTALEQ